MDNNTENSTVFLKVEGREELDTKTQFQILGEGAYLLSKALLDEDKHTREKLFDLAGSLFSHIECECFWLLYFVSRFYDAFEERSEHTEFALQRDFNKIAHILIPGASIVKGPKDRHNIPDTWIELNGDIIPVEVKYGDFGERALAQLNRYVKTFHSKYGIAVGQRLAVEMPPRYIFISSSDVRMAIERFMSEDP